MYLSIFLPVSKMCLKIFLSILCLSLALGFCVGSYPLYPQCGKSEPFFTEYFDPDDTYDQNRRLMLSTLGSEVSSRGGYYNFSSGEGAGTIYILGLCFPGFDPKPCSDCIQTTANSLLRSCLNQTRSYEWGSDKKLCFVSYSDVSFFDNLALEPPQQICSSEAVGNSTEFEKVWKDLMEDTIMTVAASSRNYAAKKSPLIGFQHIYALMLCIPELSSPNCDACLRRSVNSNICDGKQGSNIRRPSCFVQWETYPFYDAFLDPVLPPPLKPQSPKKNTMSIGTLIAIVVVAVIIIVVLLALGIFYCRRKISEKRTKLKFDDDMTSPQSLQFDFKTLETATEKFSGKNKIGQGGFGEVYKGTLPNGTEIAVKRLSRTSVQGLKEFKNEVVVVAKLQHKNLVRILGFCLEGEEQILVYEFVPNKSLDYFLFDPEKQVLLDWTRRYDIIGGIARGILYLHQDSRITIIHRDLKAGNILLDDDMKPKIADFGMARILGLEQTRADTSKIAGTYGYMAPEYALHGQISVKSDVYSFGVLVLEIISGKMNNGFYQTDKSAGHLITQASRLWRNGSPLQFLDPSVGENYQSDDVTRCIHIALLCVQEDPDDRPTISTVISMLTNSSITLPMPRETRINILEE